MTEPPWRASVATGIGSLPGEDVDEAVRMVLGELPDLPHVPELPGRGAGADLVGRTAAILIGLHVDLQPAGWRLVASSRPGADEARAVAMLDRDLEALEVHALGYEGPLKVQAAGPLTLAAMLELPRGDRMLADYGARRDLAASLAEGLAEHVADVGRRVPGARVVVQLDEPSLPAVLDGRVPTASGFSRHRAVEEAEAEASLRLVLDAVGGHPVVHCCAPRVPVGLLVRAGARAVSYDLSTVDADDLDAWSEAVERGLDLFVGVVPSLEPAGRPPSDTDLARRVITFWDRLGVGPGVAAQRTVVTPACGLAGASPDWARAAYSLCRRTAVAVAEAA